MSEQLTATLTPETPATRRTSAAAGGRAELVASWAPAAAASATAATGGGLLVLAAKPVGGVIGVPGQVVGYIALTAAALGCLTALITPRLVRRTGARAGAWAALLAGAALIVASVTTTAFAFCAAILLTGASAGIAYTTARIGVGALGSTAATGRHALTWLAVLAAPILTRITYDDPRSGLLVAGLAGAGFGVLAVPAAMNLTVSATSVTRTVPLAESLGLLTAGFAIGAVLIPAPHLLLFRWQITGPDQMPIVAAAAATALVAVLAPLPVLRTAPVLALAAGGLLLMAVAPGPELLGIGLAVTLAAAARAVVDLDRPTAVGVTAVAAGGSGGIAGFAASEALGAVTAAGTALTLAALLVLLLTVASMAAAPRPRPVTSEGSPS